MLIHIHLFLCPSYSHPRQPSHTPATSTRGLRRAHLLMAQHVHLLTQTPMPVSSASSSCADEVPVVLRAPPSLLPSTNTRRTTIDRSNVERSCIRMTTGIDTHSHFEKCVLCGEGACSTTGAYHKLRRWHQLQQSLPGRIGSLLCKERSHCKFGNGCGSKKAKHIAIANTNRASE